MKPHGLIAIFFFMALLFVQNIDPANCQARPDNINNMGIGFMIGEPTGISVKYWNNDRSAFSIGAAWAPSERREAVHLHADLLLHSWFPDVDTGRLAFYYGIGGRVLFAGDAIAGVRVPLGFNYILPTVPIDLFVEAAPILNLTPDIGFAGNGALGLRYYF